jgi:hypothetical protein
LRLYDRYIFKIFNDPVRVAAKPKIDALNKGYKRAGGDVEVKSY